MSHESITPFDLSVLDLIEHNATGAVPYTPSYRDSLQRLYAAFQVYPSADYKDGHVTARSLSKHPSFLAENIKLLSSGGGDALEPNATIFTRYVRSLPATQQAKAEAYRMVVAGRPALHRAKHGVVVAHDPVHSLFLVPGAGRHHGLPGNYLYGFVEDASARTGAGSWAVHLHDAEDGAVLYSAPNVQDAVAKLEELVECAPFHMSELEALGFKFT